MVIQAPVFPKGLTYGLSKPGLFFRNNINDQLCKTYDNMALKTAMFNKAPPTKTSLSSPAKYLVTINTANPMTEPNIKAV